MPILNTFTSAAARAFKSVVSSVIDPFFSSVGLLLHGDLFGTTNQNNTFLDSSSNNLGITNTSVVQGSFSPYSPSGNYNPTTQGGSGYFNGTTFVELTTPTSTALGFGTDVFTVEMWVYITAYPSTTSAFFANFNTESGANGFGIGINSSGSLNCGTNSGPTLASGGTISLNQWTHVVALRDSVGFKLYINGTLSGSSPNTTQVFLSTGTGRIGNIRSLGQFNPYPTYGYISNLRVVKGAVVYTSNFTPPTSPVANIAGTGLLLNFANAAAYDASAKTNVATLVNAAVSSVQKKFGTGSLYLDGSSHFPYVEQSSTFIGSGDFTVEFWAYKTANAVTRLFTSESSIFLQDFSFNRIGLYWSSPETFLGGVPQLPLNAWTHVAVTRQGNTFRVFYNGALSLTVTSSLTTSTPAIGRIGAAGGGTSEFFNGYIDEFRLTKGVARYTASFTVPDAPYPNS